MDITVILNNEEIEALVQLTQRLGHADARQFTKTPSNALHAIQALFEIKQAIWQGAENGTTN